MDHQTDDERRCGYTFVLVHGSWHHGGLWAPVAGELRRHGHTVHTPTIAGHGPDADRNASHDDAVASIAGYIAEHDLDDFVLAGHSFGGTIIAKIAEQMPERIRRLVFFNAFVLADGSSLLDEVPREMATLFRRSVVDGTVMLPFEVWRERFIQDADLATARAVYRQLAPIPIAMQEDRLDLRAFYELIREGRLRCSYLHATTDVALPHGEWSWHPRFSARLGGTCRVIEMDGSHEVMFTAPVRLARKLVAAGRD